MDTTKEGAPVDAGQEFNEVLGKAWGLYRQLVVLSVQAGEVGALALKAELLGAAQAISAAHTIERRSKAGGLTYGAAARAEELQDDGRVSGHWPDGREMLRKKAQFTGH